MKNLNVAVLELGALKANCYLIYDSVSKAAAIVDPADWHDVITKKCEALNVKPAAALLTHGHFDHMTAAARIRATFGISLCAGAAEQTLLADANMNGSAKFGGPLTLDADMWVKDGDVLDFAGIEIQTISTPGHTAGGVCYYFKDGAFLISGDTLFKGGVGRTDLPTGDFKTLARSIKEKLFALPDDTAVYPGHGPATTIAFEKKHNIIFRLDK